MIQVAESVKSPKRDNKVDTKTGPLIRMRNVDKIYPTSSGPFMALQEVSLEIGRGEFVAVVGKSGSGKTTLMNLLTGIDNPEKGEIYVAGAAIHNMNPRSLSKWRGKNIGVVFQFFQLLPTLTVLENIILPMDFCQTYPVSERRDRAIALLKRVGIEDQANKLPSFLSGGQQQRAAIARALANNPDIISADEPTGNLGSYTSEKVLELFRDLVQEGKTVVMVTHERDITRIINREIVLADGRIRSDDRIEQSRGGV